MATCYYDNEHVTILTDSENTGVPYTFRFLVLTRGSIPRRASLAARLLGGAPSRDAVVFLFSVLWASGIALHPWFPL